MMPDGYGARILANGQGNPGDNRKRGWDRALQHSAYYHRRFEGYVERQSTDASGRRHIERVYVAAYWRQAISDRRRTWTRAAYATLYLLATALFLFAANRSTASSREKPVAFIAFLTLAALFRLFPSLIAYMATPCRMTIWEHYAGPERVRRWSLAAGTLLIANALAVVAFAVSRRDTAIQDELIGVAVNLAAALAMLLIHRLECRIPYEEIPNENEPPRGGYYIDS